MKASSVEFKVRSLVAATKQHAACTVYLRGDSIPFQIVRVNSIKPYAIELTDAQFRTVILDPADIVALVHKPLAIEC